jgi:hypothetical protein
MDLRPVDLPRLRDDLIAFAQTDIAAKMRLLDMEQERLPPADVAESMNASMRGLATAELFHVAAEMAELVETAARSLPEFTLAGHDPPSRSGFAWFARPIHDVDDSGLPFLAVALGWLVVGDTVWVTTYVDRDSCPVEWSDRLRLQFPPTFPMGCWSAPIDEDGQALPVDVGPAGRVVLAAAKTLWLLMRQPLAETTDAVYDRASRRRFQREGKEPPPVRVIGLRRPPGSASSGEGGREWHHRWIVRGHWRMAAVGVGRQQRRPVWIAPHVKGPSDAPLLGGEKVYVVKGDPT